MPPCSVDSDHRLHMPLTRKELVLAGLAAGGRYATFSPAQVQKLFFLIDREAAHWVDGPHFGFMPYDYSTMVPLTVPCMRCSKA
jgi:hypothetical protein